MTRYLFAGKRLGWDFRGLERRDCPDGYTEFLREDGTSYAVVKTRLLKASLSETRSK